MKDVAEAFERAAQAFDNPFWDDGFGRNPQRDAFMAAANAFRAAAPKATEAGDLKVRLLQGTQVPDFKLRLEAYDRISELEAALRYIATGLRKGDYYEAVAAAKSQAVDRARAALATPLDT